MPTPRPSRTDSVGAKVATVNRLVSRLTPPTDTAMDSTAVISGSDIATSEPKTQNSTTAAAARPTTSPSPCSGGPDAAEPVISSCTPPPSPAAKSSSRSVTWALGTSLGTSPASVTVAKATRPSAETCRSPPGAYGDATCATSGRAASSASALSKRSRGAGSVTEPDETAATAVSVSPEAAGLTRCSSSRARLLSVSGSENSSS